MESSVKFWNRVSYLFDRPKKNNTQTSITLKTIEATKKMLGHNDVVSDFGCLSKLPDYFIIAKKNL